MLMSELWDLLAHLQPEDEVRFHVDPEGEFNDGRPIVALVRWQGQTDDPDAELMPVEPIIIDVFPQVHPIDLVINQPGEGNKIERSDESKIIVPKRPPLKLIK